MPRSLARLRALFTPLAAPLLAATTLWPMVAASAPRTVCTVTINSADEKQSFQRHLPPGDYQFVELVQRGQPDWLASARQRGVRCDVLVISGHFDDGTEFYPDRFDDREFLTVHEMQHEACSAAGNGLFSRLKEVYLFGCNTLKSEPRYLAQGEVLRSLARSGHGPAEAERLAAGLSARYGQSNRDRLRHVFKDVPVLYGFSSKAPLGRSAGPLLERYFQTAPAGEVGSGHASPTLLKLFGPSSMVAAAGLTDTDPHTAFRDDMCRLADDRPSPAQKVTFMHQVLQRDVTEARMFLEHLERYTATLGPALRQQVDVAVALASIELDLAARERFLAFARDADESTVQLRMLALARQWGWLNPAQDQAEFLRLLTDRMARGSLGDTEVDLACSRHADPESGLAKRVQASGAVRSGNVAHAAVLACLGSQPAHEQTVRALTSARDDEVATAQVYLRHRALAGTDELRAVSAGIARMNAPAAQVRALETLAKQRLADAPSLQAIAGLFPQARSLEVQRAIAGILLRADTRLLARSDLATSLRQHRLKSPDGSDVIDLLIRLLQPS